jgi:adenosylcobinamide-GDP ribazoletransferase
MGARGGPLVALRYLTALPLPRGDAAGDLGRAAPWFPAVGLGLGALLVLGWLAAAWLFPPVLAAALLTAFWAALTGALHLDGLADTCDGLGGAWTREDALRVMRDGRSGPYGVTAIVLVLGVKVAALASLPSAGAWRALLAAPVLGRTAPLLLAQLCAPARAQGAGHGFAQGLGGARLGVGLAGGVAVALAALGPWGVVPVLLAAAGTWAFAAYLRRRLGGFTGDCLGALIEVTEAAVLALAAAGPRAGPGS